MTIQFPTIVYRDNGPHARQGGTYDCLPVADAQAYSAAINAGWYPSLPEAIDGELVVDDSGAPTREEMEQKAEELGVKFDGRTSDALLLSRIEEALKGE